MRRNLLRAKQRLLYGLLFCLVFCCQCGRSSDIPETKAGPSTPIILDGASVLTVDGKPFEEEETERELIREIFDSYPFPEGTFVSSRGYAEADVVKSIISPDVVRYPVVCGGKMIGTIRTASGTDGKRRGRLDTRFELFRQDGNGEWEWIGDVSSMEDPLAGRLEKTPDEEYAVVVFNGCFFAVSQLNSVIWFDGRGPEVKITLRNDDRLFSAYVTEYNRVNALTYDPGSALFFR